VASTAVEAGTVDAVCDVNRPRYDVARFVPFFGKIASM
jgi:hypothetical protein